jgi:hypothetical protein
MTVVAATIKAAEVRIGDRLRTPSGTELTVTRIDRGPFLGRDGMVAFVEDSDEQWFKMPALVNSEVQLIARPAAQAGENDD